MLKEEDKRTKVTVWKRPTEHHVITICRYLYIICMSMSYWIYSEKPMLYWRGHGLGQILQRGRIWSHWPSYVNNQFNKKRGYWNEDSVDEDVDDQASSEHEETYIAILQSYIYVGSECDVSDCFRKIFKFPKSGNRGNFESSRIAEGTRLQACGIDCTKVLFQDRVGWHSFIRLSVLNKRNHTPE